DRTAPRGAEAAQERHGPRQVRRATREAGHRPGAEVARDQGRGGGQVKAMLIALALAGATAAGVTVVATATPDQFGGGRQRYQGPQLDVQGNTPYDGRFVFIRLRYSYGFGGFGRRGGGPPWSHDYPRGEVHFTK